MKALTDVERFWKYVEKGDVDACWEWSGGRKPSGYGLSKMLGQYRAHRISWVIHKGPIPDGLQVLHKCDNPPCCNPNHLFLGTIQDNMDDRGRKGRNNVPRGAQCHTAILNEDKVGHIKLLIHQGIQNPEIALLFGVHSKVIRYIKTGKTWKHVQMMEAA